MKIGYVKQLFERLHMKNQNYFSDLKTDIDYLLLSHGLWSLVVLSVYLFTLEFGMIDNFNSSSSLTFLLILSDNAEIQ